MTTLSDLFDAFGGVTALATLLGARPSTVSEMKRRRSVPLRWWPKLIAAARLRGIPLDEATLVALHLRSAA